MQSDPAAKTHPGFSLIKRLRLVCAGLVIAMAISSWILAADHQQFARAMTVEDRDTTAVTRPFDGASEAAIATEKHRSVFQQVAISGVLAGVFCIVLLVLLQRQVFGPLNEIERCLGEISRGRLNVIAPRHGCREVRVVEDGVNALAADLQEILLHVWNRSERALQVVERVEDIYGEEKEGRNFQLVKENVGAARKELEEMRALVEAFVLFDVELQNGDAIAKNRS